MPVMATGGCGCCSGRGHRFTDPCWLYLPFHANGLVGGPRLEHELEVLVEPGPRLNGRHPVVDVRIVGEPDRETGDHAPVADRVEHRVLLRDPQRLAALAQRPTHRVDRGLDALRFGGIGQRRLHQVGVGGHVVGALPVLGDRQPVEAGPRGVHELGQGVPVRIADLVRFDQPVIRRGDH